MALFAITYRYAKDPDRIAEHRPTHREYLKSLLGAGGLIASGPVEGEAGPGALLLCDLESVAAVEAALNLDPFWSLGLIASREIGEWSVVFGSIGRESEH
jgi:hypothetical protein